MKKIRLRMEEESNRIKFFLDDEELKNISYLIIKHNNGERIVTLGYKSELYLQELSSLTKSEFDLDTLELQLMKDSDLLKHHTELYKVAYYFSTGIYTINSKIATYLWRYYPSYYVFSQRIIEMFNDTYPDFNVSSALTENSFSLMLSTAQENDLSVADKIIELTKKFKESIAEAESYIQILEKSDKIKILFDFPVEVRAISEQYLAYFSEFLRQISIDAVANIQHDGNRTIFSVSPQSKEEALERIYEALEVFLKLPQIDINQFISQDDRLEVIQLQSQIMNYKGQLGLAVSRIQLAQATINTQKGIIDQKDILISQQSQALLSLSEEIRSGRVLQSSRVEPLKEEVFAGIISVKKYERGFLSIDVPQLLRWFKEKLKKGNS